MRPRAGVGEDEQRSQLADLLSLAAIGLFACGFATAVAASIVTASAMPDDVTKVVWYAIRVTGILAYIVLWLTTIAGLCISGGLFPKWGAVTLPVHQVADLGLALAVLHAALLLGDRYAGFTPETLVVPFRSTYEPVWVGLGIVALYLGFVVFWSVNLRPRIGYERWRAIHYLSFVVYVFVLAHGLFAGTDREFAPMRLLYLSTGLSVVLLATLRTVALMRKPPQNTKEKHAAARARAAAKTPTG